MALPSVKINFSNGAIGGTLPLNDGVTMMILPNYDYGKDIDCQNIEDYIEQIGTKSQSKEVKAFYNQVGGNARLIISDVDLAEQDLKNKIAEYNGEIRNIVVAGIDSLDDIKMLETVAEWATNTLFAPVLFLVEPTEEYLASVANFATISQSRIAIVDTVVDKDGTGLIYYLAGRLASIPVQRSVARVKDGAIYASQLFQNDGDTLVNNIYAETRHAQGIVTARVYVGKVGFYFSDDLMAMPTTDDYALIPRRRVIDKAYRIAYTTLVNNIGDEIPVTADGNIPTVICKDIETQVESAIELNMTQEGNLGVDSSDSNDNGVKCYINPAQNVVQTSKLNVVLQVKPFGYTKYIVVDLGFSVNA